MTENELLQMALNLGSGWKVGCIMRNLFFYLLGFRGQRRNKSLELSK